MNKAAAAECANAVPSHGSGRWLDLDPAWAAVREETLDVRGHPVHILRTDAAGGDEPQLLVHGLGGSAVNWIDVLGPLACLGPVVAVDLPGFGHTKPPRRGASRVHGNAAFVSAAARALGWPRYTLHGNSMGGMVVALAAARRPAEVAGLVLVSPALAPPAGQLRPVPGAVMKRIVPIAVPMLGTPLTALGLRLLESGRWDSGSLLAQILGGHALRPSLLEAMRRDRDELPAGTLLPRSHAFAVGARSMLDLLVRPASLRDVVARIEAPTLLLGGALDPLVPERVVTGLLDARPDWEGHLLADHGHALMLEDPGLYVELVTSWSAARRS